MKFEQVNDVTESDPERAKTAIRYSELLADARNKSGVFGDEGGDWEMWLCSCTALYAEAIAMNYIKFPGTLEGGTLIINSLQCHLTQALAEWLDSLPDEPETGRKIYAPSQPETRNAPRH